MTRDLSGWSPGPSHPSGTARLRRVFARPKLIDYGATRKGRLSAPAASRFDLARRALAATPLSRTPLSGDFLLLYVDVVADHSPEDTARCRTDHATFHLVTARGGTDDRAGRRTNRGVAIGVLLGDRSRRRG